MSGIICPKPNCGWEMVWNSDWDGEDMGDETPSIHSFYVCPQCGSDCTIRTEITPIEEGE